MSFNGIPHELLKKLMESGLATIPMYRKAKAKVSEETQRARALGVTSIILAMIGIAFILAALIRNAWGEEDVRPLPDYLVAILGAAFMVNILVILAFLLRSLHSKVSL